MFERVFTVNDWYDGPRSGVAHFRGKPHAFKGELDDDWFLLWPITDAELTLVEEAWAIWRRWERAFEAGQTSIASHPALPAERARHDELSALLERTRSPPFDAIRARGHFAPVDEDNGHASCRVEWSPEA